MKRTPSTDRPRAQRPNLPPTPPEQRRVLPLLADFPRKPAPEPVARLRGSMAGKCARAVAYQLLDVERPPESLSATWNFALGTEGHEWLQSALLATGAAEVEVEGITPEGVGCHVDAVVERFRNDDHDVAYEVTRTAVEIKTVNATRFKEATAPVNGGPYGPSYDHITQACLGASATSCDDAVVVYLGKENVGVGMAKRWGLDDTARFAAEWHFDADTVAAIAGMEGKRLSRIAEVVDEGGLPPRRIPDPALPRGDVIGWDKGQYGQIQVIEDGHIVDTASTWWCAYCPYSERCQHDLSIGQ